MRKTMEMDDKDDTVYYWLFSIMSIMTIDYCLYELITFSATNSDSARYLLSALVQSQAAILALVVSLTIIAIQHSASTYSIRTIAIFKKSLSFWGTILLYIVAIISELIVMKSIGNGYVPEPYFSLICIFGISVFAALIPYYLSTILLLQPATIIQIISENITYKNLKKIKEVNDEYDKTRPIIDIINNSLIRYDTATAISGIDALGSKVTSIMEIREENEKLNIVWINYLFLEFTIINKSALDKNNILVTFDIIETIRIIGITAADRKWTNIAKKAISSIENIGNEVLKRNEEWLEEKAITAIKDVGSKAASNGLEDVAKAAMYSIYKWGQNTDQRDNAINYMKIILKNRSKCV